VADVLSLGGRFYQPAEETTFVQDAAFMALVYETGVHTEIASGGDILAAVLRSGRVPEFLACALVPVDQAWTPSNAKESAALFASLTVPSEKHSLMQALTVVITGFFSAASPSATPSPMSSAQPTTADPHPPRRSPRRASAADSGSPSSRPSVTTPGSPPAS
jgi:hypothetical protein